MKRSTNFIVLGTAGALMWVGAGVGGLGCGVAYAEVGVGDVKAAAGTVEGAAKGVRGVSGLWVWKKESVGTAEARRELVAFAAKHGFNRLFVQVRFEAGSVAAGKPVVADAEGWKDLVVTAKEKGIAIEVLDGDPEMARGVNHEKLLAKVGALIALDKGLPAGAKLAGVHLDIEPYTSKEWKEGDRQAVMKEFLEVFWAIKKKLGAEAGHMTLGADIPFWYDNKTAEGDSCVLEYRGKKANFQEHIQDVTDYVGVMSYRRKATGSNSVAAVVENEVAYAGKIGKTVCASLETGPLKETPTITFYGLPAEEFWAQKKLVEETLGKNAGFGGVLVHSYENLKAYLGK
jgi:hypothetical protein